MDWENVRVEERPRPTIRGAMRAALSGRMPPRYVTDVWNVRFDRELEAALKPGLRILDMGSGANPTVPPARRPPDCVYVGLDVSRSELERALEGSYDRIVVADAATRVPELEEQFDLVLSWFVLEHVKPLEGALESIRAYLRPGGRVIAQFSGGGSVFALLNRAIPHRLAVWMLSRLRGRDPETVFPAHYDSCRYSELARVLDGRWAEWRLLPLYTGANYFGFSRVLAAAYIGYEEWAYRREHSDLAAYYLLSARRAPATGDT